MMLNWNSEDKRRQKTQIPTEGCHGNKHGQNKMQNTGICRGEKFIFNEVKITVL